MLESTQKMFHAVEQPCFAELEAEGEPQSHCLRDALEATHDLTDAQWLRCYRQQFEMSQSNVVSYLEVTTWQNVNPGRIAEIETGQRCIPTLWREKLERLFSQLQEVSPKNRNWRKFIPGSEAH